MKHLVISVLEACFLNCVCMSTTLTLDKLYQVTANNYKIVVIDDSRNHMQFKLDNVIVTFNIDDRHVVKNIECEEV